MKHFLQYTIKSINCKLLFIFLVVLSPIIGISLYNNNLSRELMLRQYVSVQQNLLDSYTVQFSEQLEGAATFATNMAYYENDPRILALASSEASIEYAYQRILASFQEQLQISSSLDGFFLSAAQQDGYQSFLLSENYSHPRTSQDTLEAYVKERIASDAISASWSLCSFGGDSYLFYIAGSGHLGLYAGAYVRVSQLLGVIPVDMPEDVRILLTDAPASETAAGNSDVFITSAITDSLALLKSFPQNLLYESMPLMQRYTFLLAVLVIVLILVLLLSTVRLISLPLMRIAGVMHSIGQGHTEERITGKEFSTEMSLIHDTFNNTMDELQQIRIHVYEEQLQTQKAQLRNLQLQIKPHFLINSLNMVYNIIDIGKTDLAKTLIRYTVDYFRYMTKVDEDMVPISDELEHIDAYLAIQSIRYNHRLSYQCHVDEMVSDMLIPPITLQAFVENSVKYALNAKQGEPVHISIEVTSFEKDYYPYARILMRDDGKGYPEEILAGLNAGERIIRPDGEHIGMRNLTNRLRILFGDQVEWRFRNEEGAVFELTVPAVFREEGDETEFAG